ncbi:hypothetical protein NEMBOFW57_001269 [Staphylotrichum longicolle]|uniref:Transmembrane protein n=1 Tax=Staphylotrichum longicolle TaxID=669026 RepID=A0AAD4I0N7_9PEZI|nr:hypothetical protein NEMBOFW57_001269 [Staphylotrichum longicolle]
MVNSPFNPHHDHDHPNAMATTPRGLELRTRIVTQTLTRPSTTITTIVTLGDAPTSAPDTTANPSHPPRNQPDATPPTITHPHSTTLTSQQLTALLGVLVPITFLLLLLCCCLSLRRRRRRQRAERERERRRALYEYYYGDGGDEDDDDDGNEHGGGQGGLRSTPAWNLKKSSSSSRTGRGRRWQREQQQQQQQQQYQGMMSGVDGTWRRGSTWATVPPPVRFPPTPRYAPYSQSRERQIGGVGRYP